MEVGNESNFKLVHSCLSMHEARCAPACARHWYVSMFSSPFQHIYSRTHKEHRKLSVRSCDNSAYDGALSTMGTAAGAGLAWGWSGTVTHIAISDKQSDLPHRLQPEGGKINFPSHDHLIHTQYALIPIHWLPNAGPLQGLQTHRLNKGDWRRADKAREKEFHSL